MHFKHQPLSMPALCCTLLSAGFALSPAPAGRAYLPAGNMQRVLALENVETGVSSLCETQIQPSVCPASVSLQKIAVRPEYSFETVSETFYITGGARVRLAPYAESRTEGVLEAGEKVTVTGKNDLTYWRISKDRKTFYIDHRTLVGSKNDAFRKAEDIMYARENTIWKSTPDPNAPAQGTLEAGTQLQITGINHKDYARAELDGSVVYVHLKHLLEDPRLIFVSASKTMYMNTAACYLDYPHAVSGSIVDTGTVNEKVTVTGTGSCGYVRVSHSGKTCYVNSDYLSSEPVSIQPAKPAASSESSSSDSSSSWSSSDSQLEIMCAVVRQEAGSSYESALAVMSTAVNRAHSSRWRYMGATPFEQLTAPGQYSYSIDSCWQRYMNFNVPQCVIQAVQDGLAGKTSHGYTSFRSYPTAGSVCIGGNWYF